MPTVNADVGGFASGKKHIATLRLQSPGILDVEITSDGTKTVLQLIKEAAAEIAGVASPDAPIPSEWNEINRVVPNGSTVMVSLGVLVKYSDPT